MNEKRSFDAVLSHLTNRLNSRGEGSERNELEQVIRVLEAAGKVDKQYCIEVFEMFVKNTALGPYDDIRYRKDGLAIFPVSQLRALLEALPGKEE